MACPDENAIAGYIQGLLPRRQADDFVRHLDSCSRCHSLVGELARGAEAIQLRDVDSARPFRSLVVGDRVGRYVIESTLGSGGMGLVYCAYDPTLDRRVALKLVRTELLGSSGADRLLAEARAMAAISHPNVVAVYDADRWEHGAFLAMERINGPTLADWLRQSPRDAQEIVDRFLEAGAGLQAAHDAGVMHRDFKPHNVLVGDNGVARVTDFGLAQRVTFEGLAEGELMGTLAYFSPEQLFGGAIDARADQFSFCVALHEALFGVRPYVASTSMELRMRMVNRAYERPALRGVSTSLMAVIRRGLSVAPNDRYDSMRALLTALRDAVDRSGRVHVRVHAVCQTLFTVVHWWFLVHAMMAPATTTDPAPVATPVSTGGLSFAEGIAAFLMVFFALVWFGGGAIWAPINALGLFLSYRWSRRSTLLYAVLAAFSCIGLPYAIYAVWSLTRPSVKRTLSHGR